MLNYLKIWILCLLAIPELLGSAWEGEDGLLPPPPPVLRRSGRVYDLYDDINARGDSAIMSLIRTWQAEDDTGLDALAETVSRDVAAGTVDVTVTNEAGDTVFSLITRKAWPAEVKDRLVNLLQPSPD